MSFATRSYQKELLDGDDIPFADIRSNMQELNTINTLLGGHRITCKGVDHFLAKDRITIAEIGCGGGDNLAAISKMLHGKNIPFELSGVDIKPECIAYAKERSSDDINWICSDYRNAKWVDERPDVIFSSLFCHHFTEEQLVDQLKWMNENSRKGFFINDLQRNPIAYYSIRLLTGLFSKSYLVKNDAPLSVKRALIKREWEQVLAKAGIKDYVIKWQWAFRYLIVVKNG